MYFNIEKCNIFAFFGQKINKELLLLTEYATTNAFKLHY